MSDAAAMPPKAVGESVQFDGGRSGRPVVVTRTGDDQFEIRLPDSPDYAGTLFETGGGSFELRPAPGVNAVGGIGLDWSDILELF
jgi:hypothetical protein